MSGPYAQAAGDYWAASWRGVLPLPPRRKKEPPSGYTGWDGVYPSWPDVQSWIEDRGAGNVCLHLPDGVLGVDVDGYGDKVGAVSLAAAEARWGPLPATWWSTSREDHVSGIRFYRVPVAAGGASLAWPGKIGPGIETVHRGHRYAVVAPSIHPETGNKYRWITPDGVVSTVPPRVADLPELPPAWVVGLTQGREAHTYQGAGMDEPEIDAWLQAHWGGDPCHPMSEVADKLLEEMHDGAHESLRLLMRLVGMAAAGHPGLRKVLRALRAEFVELAGGRRPNGKAEAGDEWKRSLFGAVDNIVGEMAKTGTASTTVDPCDIFDGSFADVVDEAWEEKAAEYDVLVSPAPAATATTASSPLGDVLSAPEPGSAKEVSAESSDETSLDSSPQPGDEPGDEGEYQPRELTEEEIAAIRATRREQEIVDAEHKLEIAYEARLRLAARNAPPLELLGAGEFLDAAVPEPLVKNFLYKDSLTRIFGAPGCGKSFLSLDLAFSVALGRDWEGQEVPRTRVIYVMAEGQRVNTARARAWLERHSVGRDEVEGWFYAVPHKVLLTEEAVGDLVAKVRELDAGLIFFDTKNAMMIGDENSASDFAVVRRAMDLVREASDASVVLIDHTGFGDPKRARGSSAGIGAMDTEVLVENDGQRPALITTTTTRDKGDEDGTTHQFFLRSHPLIDGTPAAVLTPRGDVELPEKKLTAAEAESSWRNYDRPVPTEVLAYDGGPAVTRAMPDLARYMAHDAGPLGDPNGIGKKMSDAVRTLSERALGKGVGHSRSTVERAWSALRDLGFIEPVELVGEDDPAKAAEIRRKQTTGKHVWVRR